MFVNVIPASITPAVQRIKLTKDLHQHSDICSPNYCFKNDFGFCARLILLDNLPGQICALGVERTYSTEEELIKK